MESLNEFLIPYKGLSIGKHEYKFEVQDSFFKLIELEVVNTGNLIVNLILDKQTRLMTASLKIEGFIVLICDRCLDPFQFDINVDYEQIYKFANTQDEKTDDIIHLKESDYQIDISHLIIENILLKIPIKKVHPNDKNGKPKCNPELLNLIKEYTKKQQIDPRWEILKTIKLDD